MLGTGNQIFNDFFLPDMLGFPRLINTFNAVDVTESSLLYFPFNKGQTHLLQALPKRETTHLKL